MPTRLVNDNRRATTLPTGRVVQQCVASHVHGRMVRVRHLRQGAQAITPGHAGNILIDRQPWSLAEAWQTEHGVHDKHDLLGMADREFNSNLDLTSSLINDTSSLHTHSFNSLPTASTNYLACIHHFTNAQWRELIDAVDNAPGNPTVGPLAKAPTP